MLTHGKVRELFPTLLEELGEHLFGWTKNREL
jgi:hypothetical protein